MCRLELVYIRGAGHWILLGLNLICNTYPTNLHPRITEAFYVGGSEAMCTVVPMIEYVIPFGYLFRYLVA